MADGPKFDTFKRDNAAAHCSISLKFGTEPQPYTLQTFKVKGSEVKSRRNVRYQQQKRYKSGTVGWPTSNSV